MFPEPGETRSVPFALVPGAVNTRNRDLGDRRDGWLRSVINRQSTEDG